MRRALWGALLLPWLLLFCHSDSLAARIVVPTPIGGTVGVGGDHMLQTQAGIRNALNDSSSFCIDLGSHTGQYGRAGVSIDSLTGLTTRLINLSGFADFTLAFSDSGYGRLRVDWIVIDPTDSTMSTAIDTIYLGQSSTINKITRVSLSGSLSSTGVIPVPGAMPFPCYGKLWFRSISGTGPSCLETLGPMIATTRPPPPLGYDDSFGQRDIRYTLQVQGIDPLFDDVGAWVGGGGASNSVNGYWGARLSTMNSFNGVAGAGSRLYGSCGEDFINCSQFDDPWSSVGGFMTRRSDYDIMFKSDTVTASNTTMRIGLAAIGYWTELQWTDFCGAGTKGTKPPRPVLAVYARVSDGTWWVRMARGDSTAFDSVQVAGAPAFTSGYFAPFYHVRVSYTPARSIITINKVGVPSSTVMAVLDSATYSAYPGRSIIHLQGNNSIGEGMGLKFFAHNGVAGGNPSISGIFWNPYTVTYR